jgi:ribose transport system substrate-binding protein
MKKTIVWVIAIVAVIAMSFLGIGCKTTTAETTAAETTVAATTAAAETTAAATTVAGPKPIKIGYGVTYGTNLSVQVIVKGAIDACKDAKWASMFTVDVILTDAGDTDPGKLVGVLEDLYAQQVDGLLVFPAGASDQCTTPVKDLFNKNNIPVAITDAGITAVDYVCFAVSDNYLGGQMAAEEAAKFMDKGSKVQAWNGTPGSPSSIARCQGYEDKMKELGMTVLPTKGTSVSLEQSQKDMEDLLVSDPDIKGVFSTNYILALGALKALQNADLVGKVQLTPFDIVGSVYDSIKDGSICAAVVQQLDLVGGVPAEALMKTLAGEPVDQKDVLIPPKICTKANAADFANDPQANIR